MTGESEEVGIHLLYVDLDVRHRLCSVHQYGHTMCVGCRNHLLDRVDSSQYITYLNDAHYLCPLGEELLIFI